MPTLKYRRASTAIQRHRNPEGAKGVRTMIDVQTSKKRLVPLAATFAAVYGMLRLVPFSVFIGPSGRVLTTSEFFAPLLGVVLGPYAGSLAAVVGTFVGIVITSRMNFFGLDFLTVMMNALVLGLIMRRKWIISVLLYAALLVLFFVHPSTLHFVSVATPNGRVEVPYPWLHIVAWLLLVSPLGRKSAQWISDPAASRVGCAACLLALIGTTAQNLTGNLLFASMAVPLMGMTPESLRATWLITFYVYPIERLFVVLAATTLTVVVVRALKFSRLSLGSFVR